MTHEERDELIDLYADDALPLAWQARLEADPAAVREAEGLRAVSQRLKAAPAERPDDWFAERALDRLLREHAQETETEESRGYKTPGKAAPFG